ncbi:hypothetical protein, partial [Pseudophaeobacter profundi]|uniref:hypothetical protein n=1 Tax=Pseudophaeobacter profundi TaxID=3034152 RepID=UPI00242FC1B9
VIRPPKKTVERRVRKLNPLVNTRAMLKLNPFAAVMKRKAVLTAQKRLFDRDVKLAEKRGIPLDPKSQRKVKMLALRKEQI